MRVAEHIGHPPGGKTKFSYPVKLPRGVGIKKAAWSCKWGGNKSAALKLQGDHTTKAAKVVITGGGIACQYDLILKVTDTEGEKHIFKFWVDALRKA